MKFSSPLILSTAFLAVAPRADGTTANFRGRSLIDCAADRACPEGEYCQDLKCYDGSAGDKCLVDSECQDGLVCMGLPGAFGDHLGPFESKCYEPSEKGVPCSRDAVCIGYCNNGLCWDGVDGDSCANDSDCQGDLNCVGALAFKTCRDQEPEGGGCGTDEECLGYCHNLKCWDGSDGDDCGNDSDCQGSLTCYGVGLSKKCTSKKEEGAQCGADADCIGYCHNLICWDGSEGDSCGSDSDCAGSLTCQGFALGKQCTSKKGEGGSCGADSDCLGYCQHLRCYDGSRGDPCKHGSDCQSGRCEKRCRICAKRECK
ncbi:WAP four-disulfide core domain 5 [Seminavis robusta]|uniref:WAP four-disulfide core domain 5 n=1 Tax=Seminavis robusta TaxID=568900 RepID=A0A9N8E6V3_9STRA|nr:WAP four-disulfide core domain 5 [Seminavis robusta]|eukprot:Sro606_g174540.1 WAP four-disulfide core domain 5 (315) ;mRNA; r:46958-47902